jgi:hypothetical protein
MTVSELIETLFKLGLSYDSTVYIDVYGSLQQVRESDLTKDNEGDLVIKP